MISEGRRGEIAEGFRHILIARWLGVAPWDLEAAPAYWRDWCDCLQEVVGEVSPILEERESMRRKAREND